MVITATELSPIVALIAGILILIMPRLFNFIVAIYLIFIGLVGLNAIHHFVNCIELCRRCVKCRHCETKPGPISRLNHGQIALKNLPAAGEEIRRPQVRQTHA